MSTAPILLPAPETEKYGYIAGRFIEAALDSSDDPDSLPDYRPSMGSVLLTPVSVMSTDGRTIIGRKSASFGIDPASGELINDKTRFSGPQALWVGFWKATFAVVGTPLAPIIFELTEAHTSAAPFELVLAQPYVPPPGATVQLISLPPILAGRNILVSEASGLSWITKDELKGDPGAASTVPGPPNELAIGDVSTGAPGSSAVATVTGDYPDQKLNLVIPRGDPGTDGDSPTYDAASLNVPGLLNAVFIEAGGTIPAGTPPWSLVIEVDS